MEAELLPYNEHCRGNSRGPGIEEFWHLSRIRSDEYVQGHAATILLKD